MGARGEMALEPHNSHTAQTPKDKVERRNVDGYCAVPLVVTTIIVLCRFSLGVCTPLLIGEKIDYAVVRKIAACLGDFLVSTRVALPTWRDA